MKTVVAFLMVLDIGTTVAMAQRAELRRVVNGRKEETLSASTQKGGRLLLRVRDISLEGNYPDGRPSKSGLLILFDPGSHCFFWEHSLGTEHAADFRDGWLAAYADKDRLTVFRVLGRIIIARESDEKAASLDDAEVKAIEGARAQLGTPQSAQLYGWQTVPFGQKLANDEFY